MLAPGSGQPPSIYDVSSTCSGVGGASVIMFTVNKRIAGAVCDVQLINLASGDPVWEGALSSAQNVRTFTVSGQPNATYYVTASNGEGDVQSPTFEVNCQATPTDPTDPLPCTIAVEVLSTTPPTAAGGYGGVTFRVSGTNTAAQSASLFLNGQPFTSLGIAGDGDYTSYVYPPAIGQLAQVVVYADPTAPVGGCSASADFTVPAFVPPVVVAEPTEWFAVGGVLPNPALLACPVASLTRTGVDESTGNTVELPRLGLHIEVELFRVGLTASFATARKTVRVLDETLDAANYLRAQLHALAGYSPRGVARDGDACLPFTYRYREVDSLGAGAWVERTTPRYAVLAAPGYFNTHYVRFVADPKVPGEPTSAFPRLTYNVGLPLELTILIPPNREAVLYLEHQYFDAGGRRVAIASWPVAAGALGGLLRFPHVANILPCAVRAVSALVNLDRSFTGECLDGGTVSPPDDGGFLLVGPGRLKLFHS